MYSDIIALIWSNKLDVMHPYDIIESDKIDQAFRSCKQGENSIAFSFILSNLFHTSILWVPKISCTTRKEKVHCNA